MASGTDYAKLYNEAYVAYGQGNYEEAATLMEPMAEAFPEDPDVLLLRGHIYFSLGKYDTACQQYQSVLQRTERKDLLECANQGLTQAEQLLDQSGGSDLTQTATENRTNEGAALFNPEEKELALEDTNGHEWPNNEGQTDWGNDFDLDGLDWDSAVFNEDDLGEPTIGQEASQGRKSADNGGETTFEMAVDPFSTLSEINPFPHQPNPTSPTDQAWPELDEDDLPDFSFSDDEDLKTEANTGSDDDHTFLVSSGLDQPVLGKQSPLSHGQPSSSYNNDGPKAGQDWSSYPSQDEPTIQATPMMASSQLREQNPVFDDFGGFEDDQLEDLSNFDFTEATAELPDSDLFTEATRDLSSDLGLKTGDLLGEQTTGTVNWVKPDEMAATSLSTGSAKLIKPLVEGSSGYLGWFVNGSLKYKPWIAAGTTGVVSFLGILLVSGLAWLATPKPKTGEVVFPPQSSEQSAKPGKPSTPAKTNPTNPQGSPEPEPLSMPKKSKSGSPGLLLALVGGLTGFGTTLFFGLISTNQLKRTIDDLQAQFDAMYAGDYNVKATVISQDELGQLSTSFNQLARVILTTTSEAQQRATETEQAREDLQRQVIRLLDDVEGAARGDLTVEAEVTADVLGAVADAFNLTIHNLREIVAQVKRTAKQVNQSSTDSELFARNNSSDALRMAEELAVTLNSVQVMTESIQRVAENAREAEEVAHTSSVTALKGGEAVERTVAGILQIRETVSETTRKVKRLAEASQEISKIVALISQIASRTNLLALNASIQAARAGEAGRGFAIVADEVRQLADRSAKSLKEIEQIVLQIQSETGSVMTAMEEGIQQVIDVTDKSEQAKRSLEDIIEVSNHINTLVRSITGDTIQQRENSKAVGQVMQSVELTAQETSQESQRVAGSLQNLVGISRDLLASVERFRIEPAEK
ncbi:methyl-accepting chemotaxis protein [Crocosphaera sp. UHCC 0190]|uniref:methyl-accepting chemotaxis protein n=1 Tax=Crocosphaera sp. UHCC 0190 TaxID=3110246 RepID=UPI002B21A2B9|nr:methyl-accepting chemotaxis protein [Crocosphaera sp. UHCC 0190]MEA5508690.1 methyl-accepting chemotaxis protein [Crocosphaera sp. UHCC 0190]